MLSSDNSALFKICSLSLIFDPVVFGPQLAKTPAVYDFNIVAPYHKYLAYKNTINNNICNKFRVIYIRNFDTFSVFAIYSFCLVPPPPPPPVGPDASSESQYF